MTVAVTAYHPLGIRTLLQGVGSVRRGIGRAGHMLYFFGRVLGSLPITVRAYQRELLRSLSDITWGNGSVVVGGGTVGVALVLGVTAGALVGVEGFNMLNLLGLGPAAGLLSSFGSTRETAPIMVGLAFAIQAGCRFTAQLGAMRIAEEIDALDALAIKPVPYLVTTRVSAAVVAVIPLFLVCLAATYVSCQIVVTLSAGAASSGTYMHYFSLFMNPRDVLYSTFKAAFFVFVASTIQCYYGYFASGGPAGVGVAAGRAMRASITAIIVSNMLLTMAFWGVDANARFGG